MRSLILLFFLIYLLPSILSIIPSFFIVFNIGLVFMVLLLTGSHLISPHVLKQSPSKIPLHLSRIFLVVYLKVPSLAHFFSLFIQLLLALSSQRTQLNTTSIRVSLKIFFLKYACLTPSVCANHIKNTLGKRSLQSVNI